MKELADYWQHTYDWRKHEATHNTFDQFKTDVDGVGVRFILERGKGPIIPWEEPELYARDVQDFVSELRQ